mgnify:CR=1 FL=1
MHFIAHEEEIKVTLVPEVDQVVLEVADIDRQEAASIHLSIEEAHRLASRLLEVLNPYGYFKYHKGKSK